MVKGQSLAFYFFELFIVAHFIFTKEKLSE